MKGLGRTPTSVETNWHQWQWLNLLVVQNNYHNILYSVNSLATFYRWRKRFHFISLQLSTHCFCSSNIVSGTTNQLKFITWQKLTITTAWAGPILQKLIDVCTNISLRRYRVIKVTYNSNLPQDLWSNALISVRRRYIEIFQIHCTSFEWWVATVKHAIADQLPVWIHTSQQSERSRPPRKYTGQCKKFLNIPFFCLLFHSLSLKCNEQLALKICLSCNLPSS